MPVVMISIHYSLILNNIEAAEFPSPRGRRPQAQLAAQPAQGALLALRQRCHQARESLGVLREELPDELLPLPGQADLNEAPVRPGPLPLNQAAPLEIPDHHRHVPAGLEDALRQVALVLGTDVQ